MRSRLDGLQQTLEEILGARRVYFQPPESLKLRYPCIIYDFDNLDTIRADDTRYLAMKRYSITVIDEDPDSSIFERILALPYTQFDRSYVAENLNHFVVTLYY